MHLSELEGAVIVEEVVFALMKLSLQILIQKFHLKMTWRMPENFLKNLEKPWYFCEYNQVGILNKSFTYFWMDELYK